MFQKFIFQTKLFIQISYSFISFRNFNHSNKIFQMTPKIKKCIWLSKLCIRLLLKIDVPLKKEPLKSVLWKSENYLVIYLICAYFRIQFKNLVFLVRFDVETSFPEKLKSSGGPAFLKSGFLTKSAFFRKAEYLTKKNYQLFWNRA